jgi:hypothetical protein
MEVRMNTVGAADFALLVKGENAETYLRSAHEYVSGLTTQNILALADAVMFGRRVAIIAELEASVVASLAYDLGENVDAWVERFTLRPVRPGGPRRLARDLIRLAAVAVNGSAKEFAALWRIIFDDRYDFAPCEECGARSTRVLKENGWVRSACDDCRPAMPLIGFNLGTLPAAG